MKLSRRTFIKLSGSAVAASTIAVKFSPLESALPNILSPSQEAQAALEETVVPTTCWVGKQDCGMLVRKVGNRVVKLQGHPDHPRNLGTLCPKGEAQIIAFYDPNRVKRPLQRLNEKGVPGEWKEITWEEALETVAQRIREVREKDPSLILWQKGRSKAKAFYDKAFVKAVGATKLGHGGYCSDAGYRASEYTLGPHGVLHPDFRNTRYLISWGWNITNAGGNKLCWITWPRQFLAAKERGMKVVHIDPRLRSAGPFADVWLPIKPGTDMALALAICNVLIESGYVDVEYLKAYTNAPFLVGDDGLFLRIDDKEQVWDEAEGEARPYDEASQPALEGEYIVNGQAVRPAFELFKEHVAQYTPEWAADVCGIPAESIRQLALELGENALIGSTINVDGKELPYRPVSVMAYHVAQQELGFQAMRAINFIFMLLGAIGAVGGPTIDFGWKVHKNYKKLDEVEIKDPPYNFYLKDSKFFPINTGLPGLTAKVMKNPQKYGVEALPEILIIHMANPLASFPSQEDFIETYSKFKFVVDISPWLSETADYFADIILPAATIEKYEGPASATDQYIDAVTLRLPPMDPLFESRGEIEIYMDLCERVGVLYGDGGYLDELNKALKLEDPYKIPTDRKPTVREIFDTWARAQGIDDGIQYFEKHGVYIKGPVPASKYYGYATDPPFGGVRHRLYGESLLRYQREMKSRGVEEVYWRDYTPFPTWRQPTMEGSPPEYNLYLISYKLIEHKQSRTSFIPLLAEIAPRQHLDMNPATARALGLREGDEVWVESHNAVTGETRRVKVRVSLISSLRPDTVGMPHHYGMWTHPWSKGQGPTPNSIFYTGEGYVTNTADQAFHVKVRVYRAGGE